MAIFNSNVKLPEGKAKAFLKLVTYQCTSKQGEAPSCKLAWKPINNSYLPQKSHTSTKLCAST